jgi:peptide/nickel transport system permease protein
MVSGIRAAKLFLLTLVAIAVLADLLASSLPLACRVDDRTYLLPCITRPAELADDDNHSIARRAAWSLRPPIPYGPLQQRIDGKSAALEPPSRQHWLGTDDRGRDVLARLLHGTRVAFAVGPLAVALYLLIGVSVGVASSLGGKLDLFLGRLVEVGLTFPTLFLLLCIQGLTARASLAEVGVAIALTQWPEVARLTRAEALRVRALGHVEAARAVGAPPLRLLAAHILPLAMAPALVQAAFGIAQAVLFETALTFLGFGVPPPTASWGELLAQAQATNFSPWLLWPPALLTAALVLACQRLAESLRKNLELPSS